MTPGRPPTLSVVSQRLRAALRRARRARLSQREIWERELPTEVEFWREVIETKGLHWPWTWDRGLDPRSPLIDPLVIGCVERVPRSDVEILDVGAGPITALGKTHPGRTLHITAVDPLADAYAELLREADVTPPVTTQPCAGEDVARRFGPAHFDIAHARNSVDHSANPVAIVEAMLEVVRPGGFVALRHYRNEAEVERYEELHQWNFDVRDGALWLWNRREEVDLSERLAGRATITASVEGGSDHAPWVVAELAKSA